MQQFNHLFHQVRDVKAEDPDDEDVHVSLLYNPATPLPGGISGELVYLPVYDAHGTGCTENQWMKMDLRGKMPLVKRGTCPLADKVRFATNYGVTAVIFYNDSPGKEYRSATLQAVNVGKLVPCRLMPLEDGQSWIRRLAAGEKLRATLVVDATIETRLCWNIFYETEEGGPCNVVMLRAHLDSVLPGPEVNDDGSGTITLLEIMASFYQVWGLQVQGPFCAVGRWRVFFWTVFHDQLAFTLEASRQANYCRELGGVGKGILPVRS